MTEFALGLVFGILGGIALAIIGISILTRRADRELGYGEPPVIRPRPKP